MPRAAFQGAGAGQPGRAEHEKANAIPHPLQLPNGKLLMAYWRIFHRTLHRIDRPQYPPTVPSSSRFTAGRKARSD